MVYNLNYRRPVPIPGYTSTEATDSDGGNQSTGTSRTTTSVGIPDALAFDNIINGGTCPPCTTRDFMNYLLHVEHAAENLQFFLWHRDYTQRFYQASKTEIALAPEWTQIQQETALQEAQAQASAKKMLMKKSATAGLEMLKGTDFNTDIKVAALEKQDPFVTPPQTADPNYQPSPHSSHIGNPWDAMAGPQSRRNFSTTSNVELYHTVATEAFQAAGLNKPFTIQPFREEITRVIGTYIAEGGTRELNISSRERYAILRALEYTTHPSAFTAIHKTVESSLRNQAHRNFIRWSICNGNRPRVIFARGLGVTLILFGIVTAVLIALSGVGRGWRVLPIILDILGVSTLIAAYKGMCVVLHGMHHRHLRPWELFEDADDEYKLRESLDSSYSKNSYEDEPWVVKYDKRNIIRKIFDKEVWIEEPALRQIQDTIFIQAMLGALLSGIIITAIFLAVPKGDFF
ncbi:hypothetical protein BP6252_04769 [Coleophoma cylindrospora]|uniref:RGS domain-containing protein n=1 Tax=Coleophoma cylindrospora TaxID=1849047 RepID=A0A3D8S202_9HELO|nr:hypothetical protein BP6252_04769 [Coleophoma cylindrospora]